MMFTARAAGLPLWGWKNPSADSGSSFFLLSCQSIVLTHAKYSTALVQALALLSDRGRWCSLFLLISAIVPSASHP